MSARHARVTVGKFGGYQDMALTRPAIVTRDLGDRIMMISVIAS